MIMDNENMNNMMPDENINNMMPDEKQYSSNYYQNNNVNGMAAWYESLQMQQNGLTGNTVKARNDYNSNTANEADMPDKRAADIPEKKKKSSFGITLLKVCASALLFGLISGIAFWGVKLTADKISGKDETKVIVEPSDNNEKTEPSDNATDNKDDNSKPVVSESNSNAIEAVNYDVADVAENVMPSIVSITGTYVTRYDYWFDSYESETPGAGSGIIIGKDDKYLYIVTNYHVVENAKELSVSFVDDSTADAIVKGYDEQHDTAIVLVNIEDIKADTLSVIQEIKIGSSESLRVGDPCIAIGNALGYGQSVTVGYISALERELSLEDGNLKVIQTDAAINPGNSGGALVNMKGELIGINTAKYVDSTVEGTGYALPISDVLNIINSLIESEDMTPAEKTSGNAFLGISGQTITEEYSQLLGMPKGVYISSVNPGSAAEKCGLVSGDIITSFDGKEIKDMDTLHELVISHEVGDEVEIVFYRNNNGEYEEKTVTAILQAKE